MPPEAVADSTKLPGTSTAAGATAPDPAAEAAAQASAKAAADAQRYAEVTRVQAEAVRVARENKTLASKVEALEKGGMDVAKLREEAKINPLKAMKALGLDFKQVADFAITNKDGVPDPTQEALAEVTRKAAALETKLSEREKREADEQLKADMDSIQAGIGAVIDNGEQYELLKVYSGTAGESGADLVWQIMVEYWNIYGTALAPEAAATAAEARLTDYAESLATTKKVQSRLTAKAQAAAEAAKQAAIDAKRPGGKGKTPTDKQPSQGRSGATLKNSDGAAQEGAEKENEVAVPGTLAWDRKIARVAAAAKAAAQ